MTGILKNIIILAGLLALAGTGYYLFVIEGEATIGGEVGLEIGGADFESEVLLRQIEDIQKIEISGDIFSDARFNTLRDFSTAVERVPVGREQPFVRSGTISSGNF